MKTQINEAKIWTRTAEKGGTTDCTKDVILPDLYGDLGKILWYTGSLYPESVSLENGKAVYEGRLNCTILFLDEDGKSACMKSTLDYSGQLPVEGDSSSLRVLSLPTLDQLSIKAINPRKLGIRAKISPGIHYFRAVDPTPACPDFLGGRDDPTLKCQTATVGQMVPLSLWESDISFSEDIPLEKTMPSVDEILHATAKIRTVSTRVGDQLLEFKGEALVSVSYLGDDGTVVFWEKSLSISQICSAPGIDASAEMLAVGYVGSIECSPAEDMSGTNRILAIDLSYGIAAVGGCPSETEYVTDLFSTRYLSDNLYSDYACPAAPRLLTRTVNSRSILTEGGTLERPAIYGSVSVQSVSYREEDTLVKGTVTVTVVGVREDGQLGSTQVSDGFECTLPPCSELMAEASIGNFTLRSEDARVAVIYDVRVSALAWDGRRITAVCDVRSTESDRIVAARPLTIYYPAPGESLWQIAKRYRISPEGLDAANRGRETGDAMIIPRRPKVSES